MEAKDCGLPVSSCVRPREEDQCPFWEPLVAPVTKGGRRRLLAWPQVATQRDGILAGAWGSWVTAPPMRDRMDPCFSFCVREEFFFLCTPLLHVCISVTLGREVHDQGSLDKDHLNSLIYSAEVFVPWWSANLTFQWNYYLLHATLFPLMTLGFLGFSDCQIPGLCLVIQRKQLQL